MTRPVSPEDLRFLHAELAALVDVGIPLESALRALARDMRHGRLRRACEALAADLEAGTPVADALRRHSALFPPLYTAIVEVGLASGDLPLALRAIAREADRLAQAQRKIAGALAYPVAAAVLLIALAAAVARAVVLPLAEQLRLAHPQSVWDPRQTHPVLLWLGSNLWWCVLAALGAAGLLGIAASLLRRTKSGPVVDAALVAIPPIGGLLRLSVCARACRALAVLLRHGICAPTALRLAAESAGNLAVAARLRAAAARVEAGTPLAAAVGDTRALPDFVAWALGGPEPADPSATLEALAETYEDALDSRAEALAAACHVGAVLAAGALLLLNAMLAYLPAWSILETFGR
jgi:type II secretory pathway component PulF